jgi:hypothetical protein
VKLPRRLDLPGQIRTSRPVGDLVSGGEKAFQLLHPFRVVVGAFTGISSLHHAGAFLLSRFFATSPTTMWPVGDHAESGHPPCGRPPSRYLK